MAARRDTSLDELSCRSHESHPEHRGTACGPAMTVPPPLPPVYPSRPCRRVCWRASTITAGRTTMKRILTTLAAAFCAATLASPAALAQPAELSLTRLDCGTPQAPT